MLSVGHSSVALVILMRRSLANKWPESGERQQALINNLTEDIKQAAQTISRFESLLAEYDISAFFIPRRTPPPLLSIRSRLYMLDECASGRILSSVMLRFNHVSARMTMYDSLTSRNEESRSRFGTRLLMFAYDNDSEWLIREFDLWGSFAHLLWPSYLLVGTTLSVMVSYTVLASMCSLSKDSLYV